MSIADLFQFMSLTMASKYYTDSPIKLTSLHHQTPESCRIPGLSVESINCFISLSCPKIVCVGSDEISNSLTYQIPPESDWKCLKPQSCFGMKHSQGNYRTKDIPRSCHHLNLRPCTIPLGRTADPCRPSWTLGPTGLPKSQSLSILGIPGSYVICTDLASFHSIFKIQVQLNLAPEESVD